MVVWAANFVVVKDALGSMPPVGFTFLRYTLAAVALLAILRWSREPMTPPRDELLKILVLGGLGFGLYQILWTVGLVSIPAGDSALIIASTPVFTAVIAVMLGTDTLTPAKSVGVIASFVGVVLVIAAGIGIELSGSPIGFALTLGATLCWATYTSFGARVLRKHSPLVLTTWATVGGVIVLAPLGLLQLAAPGAVHPSDAGDAVSIVLAIVYSGVFAAALANVIVFRGVQLLGPTHITTIQALVPAFAVVLAFIFLGEPIRPVQVIGGAIIIAGVALTRRASERTARPRPSPGRVAS